jgi:hypothetical protein
MTEVAIKKFLQIRINVVYYNGRFFSSYWIQLSKIKNMFNDYTFEIIKNPDSINLKE